MAKRITEDGEILDENTDTVIAMAPPFWKTPFNHDTKAESDKYGLTTPEPSKTQQQFAHDADINNILRKFMETKDPTAIPFTGEPRYMNIETLADLQDVIVTGYQVEQAWNALPAAVRNILKDPQTFVDYVDHCLERGDLDPLRELGLAKPKEPPTAAPAASEPATPTGGTPAPVPPDGPPSGPKS